MAYNYEEGETIPTLKPPAREFNNKAVPPSLFRFTLWLLGWATSAIATAILCLVDSRFDARSFMSMLLGYTVGSCLGMGFGWVMQQAHARSVWPWALAGASGSTAGGMMARVVLDMAVGSGSVAVFFTANLIGFLLVLKLLRKWQHRT